MASQTSKCLITKSMQKGLKAVIGAADLEACAGHVNFAQDAGKLNARQAEFDTLFKANVCVDSAITFFNGQTWPSLETDDELATSSSSSSAAPSSCEQIGHFFGVQFFLGLWRCTALRRGGRAPSRPLVGGRELLPYGP